MVLPPGMLLLAAVLGAVWVALHGQLDWSSALAGGVLSVGIARLTWQAIFPGVEPPPAAGFLRRVAGLVLFAPLVLAAMLKGSVLVARAALRPRLSIRPGFFVYRSCLRSRGGLVSLANAITLAPGKLTVEISADRRELLIHSLTIEPEGEPDLSADVQQLEKGVAGFAP